MTLPKCKKCGGELKPKIDFFRQNDKNGFKKIQESFRKEFGKELPEPKGYNCISCGACYDQDLKREKLNLAWLGGKNG